jgi:hypothetical protein
MNSRFREARQGDALTIRCGQGGSKLDNQTLMTREEIQSEIQFHIERFARMVGLPYDPPNLFKEFAPKQNGWHYPNALTMARMSVLAYQSEKNGAITAR